METLDEKDEKKPMSLEETDMDNLYERPDIIHQNFTQSNKPKGTSYNKKSVMTLGIGVALVLGFLLTISLFSSGSKSLKTDSTTTDQTGSNISNHDLTPAELEQIPASYNKNNSNLYATNGQNISQNNLSGNNQSNQYNNSSYPTNMGLGNAYPQTTYSDTTNYVPTPPPLDPVIIRQPITPDLKQPDNGYIQKEISEEAKESVAARKSPIRLGQGWSGGSNTGKPNELIPDDFNNKLLSMLATGSNNKEANNNNSPDPIKYTPQNESQDPNLQNEKINFASQNQTTRFYAGSSIVGPLSKYELKAGAIIPVTLITGINSDLPGNIICQVSENIYDTVSGKYLLIPQGTKVIGTYDSQVSYGQNRALVIWKRLIMPNGKSLDLETLMGVDTSGYSGLKDKVNSHYGKIISGVLLASAISWGAHEATKNSSKDDPFATALAENVTSVGSKIAERNMGVQPTIQISPGKRFNLFVDKDFILEKYK